MLHMSIQCQTCRETPQEYDRKVITMTKGTIFIAGIFLACVIAAGIPAAAAADTPVKPVNAADPARATDAVPTVTPTPRYTPIVDWLEVNQQTAQAEHDQMSQIMNPLVNATADKNADNKTWWENLWPQKDNNESAQPTTITPHQSTSITPRVNNDTRQDTQIPTQTTTIPMADGNKQENADQNVNPEKTPDMKNP
ncbi:MAG: hypothetical protein LUQ71_07405 [Methanoregula sp.]|nr:hypothetical protein [Methanoregula sp.]